MIWTNVLLTLSALVPVLATKGCHDMLCASVVSKCMLTEACKCEINRRTSQCSCCLNCTQCLGEDFERCCLCLGLCEPTRGLSIADETQVGDIEEPFPQLFDVVTSVPDENKRWTYYTYPIDATLEEFSRRADLGKISYQVVPEGVELSSPTTPFQVNCTVMYLSQCISVTKCQENCSSYGAGSYRYFFDGCCECVGLTCLNYGVNESRCSECSQSEDREEGSNDTDNMIEDETT